MNDNNNKYNVGLIYDNQYQYRYPFLNGMNIEDVYECHKHNASYWLERMLQDFYEYNKKNNSYFGKNCNDITWLDVKKRLRQHGLLMLVYDAPSDMDISYAVPEWGPSQLKYKNLDDKTLDSIRFFAEPVAKTIIFFDREAYKDITGFKDFTKKGVKNLTDIYSEDLSEALFMDTFGEYIEYNEEKDKYIYKEPYQVTKYKEIPGNQI